MKQSKEFLELLNHINYTIINFRGIYAEWAIQHGISYNEMLILYTIRECGSCSRDQICQNYLLPRQTIHTLIRNMRADGLLKVHPDYENRKEKRYVLTEKGQIRTDGLIFSLTRMEEYAINYVGEDRLRMMSEVLSDYSHALEHITNKQWYRGTLDEESE